MGTTKRCSYQRQEEKSSCLEIHTSYLWLTAKTIPSSASITIVAEPNSSGKSRVLYIMGAIRNGHTNIKVIQE